MITNIRDLNKSFQDMYLVKNLWENVIVWILRLQGSILYYLMPCLPGSAILTKMPNTFYPFDSMDVTRDYKYKEGSIFERASVTNALKKSKNPAMEFVDKYDVHFSTKVGVLESLALNYILIFTTFS